METGPDHRVVQALFRSLLEGPLLVGDLPEARSFSRDCFGMPAPGSRPDFGQKLGHLYEDLLAEVLESSSGIRLLEKNLQLQTDVHTTVGELDFLLRPTLPPPGGGLVHLELAVKFYLAVETSEGVHFPGPDARDNYARKLKRLREHQLTLAVNYRDHLPCAYHGEPVEAQQLIYGCLFDHIHATEPSTAAFIHPACRRGRWLFDYELAGYLERSGGLGVIPKKLWPVPLEFLEEVLLENWSADLPVDRCVMVRITGNRDPHFVVPHNYPGVFAQAVTRGR